MSHEERKRKQREYLAKPEVKESRRAKRNTPEARKRNLESQRKCRSTPEGKAREKEAKRKYRDNPETKIKVREYGLKVNFNLAPGQWDVMFLDQGSKCAICKRTDPVGKHWHTDHCHITGKVRGILCHKCNLMLGHGDDRADLLRSGADYLET